MTRLEEIQNAAELGTPPCYDQEEILENCTVQILRNSATGETSIGWWRGGKKDMPRLNDTIS